MKSYVRAGVKRVSCEEPGDRSCSLPENFLSFFRCKLVPPVVIHGKLSVASADGRLK